MLYNKRALYEEAFMQRRLFIILVLLLLAAVGYGIMDPAIQLLGMTSNHGFAGASALQVANGSTHLTYRSLNSYPVIQIYYARILPDSTVETHLVDGNAGYYNDTAPENLPTLQVDGNTINIFYSKQGQVQRAVSTDNGASFSLSAFDLVADTLPIVSKQDGQWTSFITPVDATADSSFMYFSNLELSETGSNTPFGGTDVITGPVRSNSDVWIRQLGGGTNGGWPTFYGPVYTTGQIQSMSGTPPLADVFRGGLYEHTPTLPTDTVTLDWSLQQQGNTIGPPNISENRIMLITVNGAEYTSWHGEIVQTGFDTLWVYSDYPPGNGAPLYANIVPHVDTLWTSGPTGICAGMINVVNSPLWIRGTFSGKQTWYSPYNIMINNDILLQNVPAGEEPPADCQDFVSLVSDKRILIQYGYKDPMDSLRYKPNCDGDQQGVFIYASLYAVKPDRWGNPFKDGVFSFEYQRPHVSVPAVTIGGTAYDNIDLHRRHYPQTTQYPWQANIDLPYYNPLWPESSPTMERGTIHIFGALAQHRRGFAHRNVADADFPNPGNIWDTDNGYYGGIAGSVYTDPVLGITFVPANAPGAAGGGIGYRSKDYHFDARLRFDTFPYNPFGLGLRCKQSNDGENWAYKYFKSQNASRAAKSSAVRNGSTALMYNNTVLWQASPTAQWQECELNLPETDSLQNLIITQNDQLLLEIYRNGNAGQDSVRVVEYDPVTESSQLRLTVPAQTYLSTVFVGADGADSFAILEADGRIRFYQQLNGSEMQCLTVWNPQIPGLATGEFDLAHSSLSIVRGTGTYMDILFSLKASNFLLSQFYYARGILEYTAIQDEVLPPLEITTNLYPNPFRDNLHYEVKTNQAVKADLSIFNLKGQKVRTLATQQQIAKGTETFIWDGRDANGKPAASGIYILRSTLGNEKRLSKLLKIK
jgi:hypothetical protein